MLYGIYMKQPESESAKIRLTLADWLSFKNVYRSLNGPIYRDAVLIFHQLIKIDAYQ